MPTVKVDNLLIAVQSSDGSTRSKKSSGKGSKSRGGSLRLRLSGGNSRLAGGNSQEYGISYVRDSSKSNQVRSPSLSFGPSKNLGTC